MRSSVVVLSLWLSVASAARFLAFLPMPAPSHQRAFQPLLTALAKRNHSVTVFTPLPLADPPPNYVQVQIGNYMKEIKESSWIDEKELFRSSGKGGLGRFIAPIFRTFGLKIAERVLQEESVQRLIHSELQFDAVILETTFLQEMYIALGHKFKAPVIEVLPTSNSHWAYWVHGNPYDPSYICEYQLPYTDKMNFLERLQNTALSMWIRLTWWNVLNRDFEKVMDTHIRYEGWESRPSMMEMVANTSLVLVNSDIALNYPHPMAPHFKEVGGLNLFPPGKLPKDIQDFMDGAKDGVIFFTLGSHVQVSTALDDVRDEFVRAFSKLKQKVLWKWETDFPNVPKNVKISKWFPQQDILAHKNMKLFISHGGFLSLTESVYNGVPIIGIPLLGDQHKNIAHIKHYGYGLGLDYANLTEEIITNAINEILSNPSYKENAMKRSSLLKDKPSTGLDTAIYWVEYVIRHKGAHHLKPAVTKLRWWQAALLDVYLALALIIIIPIYITIKLLKFILKMILSLFRSKPKDIKKKKQ